MARAGQADALASDGRRRSLTAAVLVAACVLLLAALTLFRDSDDEQAFAAARARGTLIIAVPSQPAPTLFVGKVDRSVRAPEAYAVALAEEIGRRIGLPVQLRLVERSSARAEVESGRADIAIAGLPFAPDASISFAPTAYSSGRGLALVLRHGNVRDWGDLKGRGICASRESPFAAGAARDFQASVQRFDRPLDALLAFQAGECAALVDDEYVIRALLRQADWSYYRVLPGTLAPTPAFIALPAGGVASVAFVERTVSAWRRQRWLASVRRDHATQLAFEMFNAQNDLYCH
ncbi:transporter substrate-binding domain-containing protein [Caballeronia sp. LZ065]|uniref:transporter substrate-binding domain-containing protein n=1 Tax=Caballeronia sp. LZ065 TaxID=3038571 RepID=UPI0028602B07|nr:transporter substrate-binding domain-containing protein [Caballeronia sp. LZ065]MDR5781084.1 transporter substrate-binding domain-containing protein [Caballeronia sp. LZ065]